MYGCVPKTQTAVRDISVAAKGAYTNLTSLLLYYFSNRKAAMFLEFAAFKYSEAIRLNPGLMTKTDTDLTSPMRNVNLIKIATCT